VARGKAQRGTARTKIALTPAEGSPALIATLLKLP